MTSQENPATQPTEGHGFSAATGGDSTMDPVWAKLLPELLQPGQKAYDLINNQYVIGRNKRCDIVLPIPTISNEHCKISRIFPNTQAIESQEATILLEDTSSNGTFVNGALVGRGASQVLHTGDQISFSLNRVNGSFIFHMTGSRSASNADLPRYNLFRKLGSGAWGEVWLSASKVSGARFATKIIDKKKISGQQTAARILQEVEILRDLSHPNIITVHDTVDTPRALYIVLEWARGGDLFDHVVARRALAESQAKLVFYQLVAAVSYLHANGVVHRDLKLENILLDRRELPAIIKVTDFGLARIVGPQSFMRTACGTPAYQAPEVLRASAGDSKLGYNAAVDIWSLGVVLFMLLGGYPPFSEDARDEEMSLPERILAAKFSFIGPHWPTVSPAGVAAIKAMLVVDVQERATLPDLHKLDFMQDQSVKDEIAVLLSEPTPERTASADLMPPPSRKRPIEE